MKIKSTLSVFFLLAVSGCGYTTKATLPNDIRTIYVKTVFNDIPIDQLVSYEPGIEIEITNAIINRLHDDGNLKVVKEKEADAILESKVISYEQEGLRFSRLESVQEYRLYIVLQLRLVDTRSGHVIFEESGFSGQADYFVRDVRSVGRELATAEAIKDLARNVVDRITEDW